jgi:hypothetical protein
MTDRTRPIAQTTNRSERVSVGLATARPKRPPPNPDAGSVTVEPPSKPKPPHPEMADMTDEYTLSSEPGSVFEQATLKDYRQPKRTDQARERDRIWRDTLLLHMLRAGDTGSRLS